MGEEYSTAHAARLAAQLPKGSRCKGAENPRNEWSDEMWALWRIERNINLLRWGMGVKYDGEDTPKPMPYPGMELDKEIERFRFKANKSAVDSAFGMNGGVDGN
jgi:hypothetical protein